MDSSSIRAFNSQVNRLMAPLDQPLARTFLTLFLVMFGAHAVPTNFPIFIRQWANHPAFKIVFLFFIVYIANHDPAVAIVSAVVFTLVTNVAGGKKLFEFFEGPQTAVFFGCGDMKIYDLLAAFNNDKEALLNAMLVSRVPANITLTDEYAPLIATYLMNWGYKLPSPCSPPGVTENIGY